MAAHISSSATIGRSPPKDVAIGFAVEAHADHQPPGQHLADNVDHARAHAALVDEYVAASVCCFASSLIGSTSFGRRLGLPLFPGWNEPGFGPDAVLLAGSFAITPSRSGGRSPSP
jgi:hypothetical protein